MFGAGMGGNWGQHPASGGMGMGTTATNQGMNAGASGNTNMSGGWNWGNHQGDLFGGQGGQQQFMQGFPQWGGQGMGHNFGGLQGLFQGGQGIGGMLSGLFGGGGLGQMPFGQGPDAWKTWASGIRDNFQNMFHPPGQAPTPPGAPPAVGGSPATPPPPDSGQGATTWPGFSQGQGWGQGGNIQGLLAQIYPKLFGQS